MKKKEKNLNYLTFPPRSPMENCVTITKNSPKVGTDRFLLFFVVVKTSTLEILNPEDQGALLSDDQIFSSRQTAKHTCMALRRYFEAHLAIKVEHVKQSLQRTEGGAPVHSQPYYKVNDAEREREREREANV